MNRYEYFEKWMTTDEWREFKEQFPRMYRQNIMHCDIRQARARRRDYLMQEVLYFTQGADIREFSDMTNMYVRWMGTQQGYSHWSTLNNRTGPIR